MNRLMRKVLLAGLLSCVGCTTQLSTKHLGVSTSDQVLSDYTYYLPRQQVNVTLTYQLLGCRNGTTPVSIKKTAKISVANERDPAARFAIIPDKLESGNKATELKLETYDNGTLKSVGVTVDDRTAEIARSAIETGAKVAELAVAGAASAYDCTPGVAGLVSQRNALVADLRDPARYTGKDERAAAVDALQRLNAVLAITRTFSFTPDPEKTSPADRVSKLYKDTSLLEAFSARWLKGLPPTGAERKKLEDLSVTALCIRAGDDGGSKLAAQPAYCKEALGIDRDAPSKVAGDFLAYRDPLQAKVIACGLTCADNTGEVLAVGEAAFAQLGPWRQLKLVSEPFQDRNIAAQFSAAGQRTSITRGGSAALESMAGVVATAAEKGQGVYTKSQGSELDKINAETALIKAKADRIEQQNRLDALEEAE